MAGGPPTGSLPGRWGASRRLAALLRRVLRTRGAGFGLVVVATVLLIALGADLMAPYDPNQRQAAGVLAAPSSGHLLGTDQLARDVLSRILYGARTSVQAGVVSVGFALVAGVCMGLLAGYYGNLDGRPAHALGRRPVVVPHPGAGPGHRGQPGSRADQRHARHRHRLHAHFHPPGAGADPVRTRAGLHHRGPRDRRQIPDASCSATSGPT